MSPRNRPSRRDAAGRPLRHGVRLVERSISLTPAQWQRLRDIGGGNASQGVRLLLERDDRPPEAEGRSSVPDGAAS